MKNAIVAGIVLLLASVAAAQQAAAPASEDPVTFGHVVHHTAEANNFLCARIAGDEQVPAVAVKAEAGKDALVAALRESFQYCAAALGRARDARLGEEVPLFGGRPAPRAAALLSLSGTWASH